jgi:hypothetical protein
MGSREFPFSSIFLAVAAGSFLIGYALPLLFAPLRWARLFRWRIPDQTELTVYLGRCLGGVATTICLACFAAVPHPERHMQLFDMIALVGAIMTGVHVWGAIRRVQPWTETAEIGLYAALTALAIAAKPGVGGV